MYIDITDSMLNLKRFLKLRDNKPEFKEVREVGRVGVPCLVVSDGEEEKIIFGEPNIEDLI